MWVHLVNRAKLSPPVGPPYPLFPSEFWSEKKSTASSVRHRHPSAADLLPSAATSKTLPRLAPIKSHAKTNLTRTNHRNFVAQPQQFHRKQCSAPPPPQLSDLQIRRRAEPWRCSSSTACLAQLLQRKGCAASPPPQLRSAQQIRRRAATRLSGRALLPQPLRRKESTTTHPRQRLGRQVRRRAAPWSSITS